MRVKFSIDIKDADTLNMAMLAGLLETPDPLTVYEGHYYYDSEVTRVVFALLSSLNIVHDLAVVDEEAERAKFKLNMPTRDVQCSIGNPWKIECSLNSYIEQLVTEQVMKVLNSVEYQVKAIEALYPKLFSEMFSEHQHPLNTEQKKENDKTE